MPNREVVYKALLPESMKRVMAPNAGAEREKRAKIIHAKGEFQAAHTLANAAHVINREESALQRRYLRTLAEVTGVDRFGASASGPAVTSEDGFRRSSLDCLVVGK